MPEIRVDPILGSEVLFAPDRADRPGGRFVPTPLPDDPADCPFCRGRESQTPPATASYPLGQPDWRVRVVPNLYPALAWGPAGSVASADERRAALGIHEVVIETPDHLDRVLAVPAQDMVYVFQAYRDRIRSYRSHPGIQYALAFKNHGLDAGASLAHAHSQLMGLAQIPRPLRRQLRRWARFFQQGRGCLLCVALDRVLQSQQRCVALNADFAVFCPWAPRFPWETWIVPRRHAACFERDEVLGPQAIWDTVRTLLGKLERTLGTLCFNLILQTAPFDASCEEYYHWHITILPRLSRQAGFEWGTGCWINPVLPEQAARLLREA